MKDLRSQEGGLKYWPQGETRKVSYAEFIVKFYSPAVYECMKSSLDITNPDSN